MEMRNEELLEVFSNIGEVSSTDYVFMKKKLKTINIEVPLDQYNKVLSDYEKIDKEFPYCIQNECKKKMKCESFTRGLNELPKSFLKNSSSFLLKNNKEDCFEKETDFNRK